MRTKKLSLLTEGIFKPINETLLLQQGYTREQVEYFQGVLRYKKTIARYLVRTKEQIQKLGETLAEMNGAFAVRDKLISLLAFINSFVALRSKFVFEAKENSELFLNGILIEVEQDWVESLGGSRDFDKVFYPLQEQFLKVFAKNISKGEEGVREIFRWFSNELEQIEVEIKKQERGCAVIPSPVGDNLKKFNEKIITKKNIQEQVKEQVEDRVVKQRVQAVINSLSNTGEQDKLTPNETIKNTYEFLKGSKKQEPKQAREQQKKQARQKIEQDEREYNIEVNGVWITIKARGLDEIISYLKLAREPKYLQVLIGLSLYASQNRRYKFENVKVDDLMKFVYRRHYKRGFTREQKIQFCKILDVMDRMRFKVEINGRWIYVSILHIKEAEPPQKNGVVKTRDYFERIIEGELFEGIEKTGLGFRKIPVELLDLDANYYGGAIIIGFMLATRFSQLNEKNPVAVTKKQLIEWCKYKDTNSTRLNDKLNKQIEKLVELGVLTKYEENGEQVLFYLNEKRFAND